MNTTFQRSNERAPVYELPPMANTIKKNVSNMNTQSSPGFDPFPTSFITHAEKRVWDDRGKKHTENVILPLLAALFHRFLSEGVIPRNDMIGEKSKIRLFTRKVQVQAPKITVCWLSMAVSYDFLQMW